MNETIDELANAFVRLDEQQNDADKDLRRAQALVQNLQGLRNDLRNKLGKFVGANVSEKLVIVGNKVLRIKLHRTNDQIDVEIHNAHVVK